MKKVYILSLIIISISGCVSNNNELENFFPYQQKTIIERNGKNKIMSTSGTIITYHEDGTMYHKVKVMFSDKKEQETIRLTCLVKNKESNNKLSLQIEKCTGNEYIGDIFLSTLVHKTTPGHQRRTITIPNSIVLLTKKILHLANTQQAIPLLVTKENYQYFGSGEIISYITGNNKKTIITSYSSKKEQRNTINIDMINKSFSMKHKNSLDTIDRLSIQGERKKRGRVGSAILSPPEGDIFRLDGNIHINRSRKTTDKI